MTQDQTAVSENTPGNTGITSKVVGGSLWTVGGQVAVMIASLLATTFVIRLLGTELYGAWSLIVLIIGYTAQGDLGMGVASTRFASEAFAKGDEKKENRVIWTAFLIAITPSLLIAASLTIFAKPLMSEVLKIPAPLQPQVIWALILVSLCFPFRIAGNVFNTPQLVRLRMDINTSIISGLLVLQIFLIPVAIWIWGGIIPAAAVVAAVSFLTMLALYIASQRLLPILKHPSFDFSLIKPLTTFGGTLILSSAAGIILGTIEKPLLARYASVTTFAHYAIASTLASVMSIFPIAVSQSLLPAFTRLYTSQDISLLKSLYDRAIRGNLMWVLPMAHFLCVIARPFFTLWAGEEFGREATIPLYIMVIGLVVNVFAYVPYTLLQASGRARLIVGIYWAEIIPYIFVASALISAYGAAGAAIAWSLRIFIDAILFFVFIKPVLGNVLNSFFSIGGWYWGTLVVFVISTVLLVNFVTSVVLLVMSSGFLITMYLIVVVTKVLQPDERKWFFQRTNFLWLSLREKLHV